MAPKSTADGSTSKVIKTATKNELAASLKFLTSTGTKPTKVAKMKRPAAAGMKKRPAAAVEEEEELEENIVESTQADRNKKNFALQNMSEIPEEIIALINTKPAHKKKDVYNNIVQKRADGKWEFNFDSRFVKDICFGIPSRNQYTNK